MDMRRDKIRKLEDQSKRSNIWLIGNREKDSENGEEKIIKEIIQENFPKLKDRLKGLIEYLIKWVEFFF